MRRLATTAGAAALVAAGAWAAWASSPDAWAELQAKAEAACMAASGLDEPEIVAPPTNFEKHVFVVVKGIWPKPPMEGREAEWVCLYDKEKNAAEARERGFP